MSSLHAALTALAAEHRAGANPAPYTSERALIERVEHLLAEHAPTDLPEATTADAGAEAPTPLTGSESYPADRCPEHGPKCSGETCCCLDKHRATSAAGSSPEHAPTSEPTLTEDEVLDVATAIYANNDRAPWLATVDGSANSASWDYAGRAQPVIERIVRDRLAAVEAERDRARRFHSEEYQSRCDLQDGVAALRQQVDDLQHQLTTAAGGAAVGALREAENATLRQQVDDLRARLSHVGRVATERLARAEAAEQTVAAQAQVIKRVRALPQRILIAVDPLGSGAEVRMACVALLRAALDAAPTPPADARRYDCPDCDWSHVAHPEYGWQGHDDRAVEVHRQRFCPMPRYGTCNHECNGCPTCDPGLAPTPPAETEAIEDLVERSSLGTPEATALRTTVTDERAARVVARAKELAAEAEGITDGYKVTLDRATGRIEVTQHPAPPTTDAEEARTDDQ
ncbi:hypothetical protein [Nocardioides sp. LML1-1-1.1]|uniref:hypothetical protein n=1 Tax=Nocardioides sp. LML1-1-1.1 TaxID=3135248 RepID=UPI00342F54C1